MPLLKSPEDIQAFVDGVNAIRAVIVRGIAFDKERSELFADLRRRRVDHNLAKEVAKRYESKDPMAAHEFDRYFEEAVEIYAKSLNVAQELLRARSRNLTTPIASTTPQPPPTNGNGLQATAADNASFPGDVSAATFSDTAAAPGEATAAVSAPPAKADDASVRTPRKSIPVFARYKNGAHA